MAQVYDVNNWFWTVNDTNPGTSVFKTKSGSASGFVGLGDADFLTWLSAGGPAFGVNQAISAAADNGAGGTRLTINTTGSAPFAMTVGAKYNVSGTGGLYDGNQALIAVGANTVDIAVAFAGTATGTLVGATIIDTAVSLQQVLNQAGLGLLVVTGNYYVPVHLAISSNTTLSNPLSVITFITNSSAGTVNVQLPPMNQPNSIPEGLLFIVSNQTTSASPIQVKDQSNTNVGPILYPGDKLFTWLDLNSLPAGTLDAFRLPNFATASPAASGDGRIPVSASLAATPSAAHWVAPSGDLSMDDQGAFTLASTITAGGPTGDATHVAQITYDAKGRLTTVTSVAITGTPPGGSAGGDLGGTYPNPTVTAIENDASMKGDVLATEIAAPSAPGVGLSRIYVDSTSHNLAAINHAGTVNHGVQTKAAVTHNFLTAIADDGTSTLAQPAFADLSDFTDWTSWTPTWTGSGNGASVTMTGVSAHYTQLKKAVLFTLNGTISSIGSATGTLQFTLPTSANAAGMAPGYEAGLTGKQLQARISAASNVVAVQFYDNTNMLTNGDVPVITGLYWSQ